uniref:Uncharacterized protein n=1 Tax=Anguilla anguilla TaxID=7936 RepID=A0A0E9VJZ9_ANGAN
MGRGVRTSDFSDDEGPRWRGLAKKRRGNIQMTCCRRSPSRKEDILRWPIRMSLHRSGTGGRSQKQTASLDFNECF